VDVVTSATGPLLLPLEPSDELALRSALRRVGLSEEAAIRAALPWFGVRVLGRGEYLLRADEMASLAGVLVSGLLREHFVTERGIERTKSFVMGLQFTGSLADLLSGEPSRAFIVAEETSRLVLAPYTELRRLEQAWPSWAAAARRSLEHLLLDKATREYEFMCFDAERRYASFLARYPHLEAKVAASHIASYLAITPVHLSRLRARRARARPG
jgi:CRP-like cAMP-binding protein